VNRTIGLLWFAAGFFGAAFSAAAQESGGTQSPVFTSRPDARIQGLGGISACLADNASSCAENPALVRTLKGFAASTGRIVNPTGASLYAIAAGLNFPANRAGFFAQWRQLVDEGMPNTAFVLDSSGNPVLDENLDPVIDTSLSDFDDISNSFHAGCGFSILPWIQAGIAAKGLLRYSVWPVQTGWGMDAGIHLGFPEGPLHIGLSVSDLVPVQLESGENERMAVAGCSFEFRGICLAGQVENFIHDRFDRQGSLGIAWRIARPVILQAGWSPDYYSLGSGIYLGPVRIHYAVVHHSDYGFENPHRITLEYSTGG